VVVVASVMEPANQRRLVSSPPPSHFRRDKNGVSVSIVVSMPACHAGDRGSIPRQRAYTFLCFEQTIAFRHDQHK
jgi:hypothetical protein